MVTKRDINCSFYRSIGSKRSHVKVKEDTNFVYRMGIIIIWKENIYRNSEEEINRELQRDTICDNITKHKLMDILWDLEAWWLTCCHRQCCWCSFSALLCHSLHHLCPQTKEGRSLSLSHCHLFLKLHSRFHSNFDSS